MMRIPVIRLGSVAAVLLGILIVGGACGDKKPKVAKGKVKVSPIEAAIVPGADLILSFDVRAVQEAAIVKKMEQIQEEAAKKNPLVQLEAKKKKRFEEAMGLTVDDIISVLVSADIDSLDLSGKNPSPNIEELVGVMALALAKPVSIDKLKAGLKIMAEGNPMVKGTPMAKIAEIKLGGTTGLRMTSGATGASNIYVATSTDGKVVYVALTQDSLQQALDRADKGQYEQIPSEVSKIEGALPGGTQMRVVFRAPNALRDRIKKEIADMRRKAGSDPGSAMALGLIAPFEKIKSLALGVKFDVDAEVCLLGDLGGAQQASQATMVIQSMVIPMMQGMITQGMGGGAPDISKNLKLTSEGSILRLTFRMKESDMLAAGPMAVGAPSPMVPKSSSPRKTPAPRSVKVPPPLSKPLTVAPPRVDMVEEEPVELEVEPIELEVEPEVSEVRTATPSLEDGNYVGASLADIEKTLGPPSGVMKSKKRVIWMYDNLEIISEDGKKVSSVQQR